jgi:hypothetical protein
VAKSLLDELIDRVEKKPAPVRKRIAEEVHEATKHMAWVPNPGPQTDAYLSEADILLYGGQAGGGKSHLELGWGINEADGRDHLPARADADRRPRGRRQGDHRHRELERLGPRVDVARRAHAEARRHEGGRQLDGHAGRERDYMGFDEAGEFLEQQVGSLFAWLRARRASARA